MKIGFGYDIHRFKKGRRLVLGGVEIKHPRGLDGHSDADVIVHAIMDALAGAAGLGDIGKLFPNDDPRYKNASSLKLLARVGRSTARLGYRIVNIDTTLVAEEPKISAYSPSMKKNISRALGVDIGAVGVKATTNERLGAVGSKKGAACFAVCLLIQNGKK